MRDLEDHHPYLEIDLSKDGRNSGFQIHGIATQEIIISSAYKPYLIAISFMLNYAAINKLMQQCFTSFHRNYIVSCKDIDKNSIYMDEKLYYYNPKG